MKRCPIRRNLTALLAVLLTTSALNAASFIVPPDEALVRSSDVIVLGTVESTQPQFDDQGEIVTLVNLRLDSVIKGDLSVMETVRVLVPGGVVGGQARRVSGMPAYWPNGRVLAFLKSNGGQFWVTYAEALGKFEAIRYEGVDLFVRGLPEEEIFGWDHRGNRHHERARRRDEFLDFVRRTVDGETVEGEYLWPEMPSRVRPAQPVDGETFGKSLLSGGEESPQSHFPPSAYLMGGTTKFRWDVFDRGGSVSYRISGSQPGYDSNGAAQRSVAAWTNDPGSNINAAIGGTTSAGFTQDGVSAIVFNSSSAVPAGAIGYSQIFSGGTHSYKGETFYTINEGDVVMRSGLAVSASVFEEAVAHELGHSLGFRHSNEGTPSSSAAIMNSVVSGAYGANLQAWDREAAGHVYTAAVVAPPPPPTGSGVRGDFNADGHTDLIWRNYTTGETHIWLMNRGTYTGSAVLPVIPIAWRIEAVADFNQDGHSDIVWRNYTTGETHIWLMNRTSHAGSAVLSPLAVQWELQASGDFNGDNRPDIVWRNITTGQTHIWLMNGVVYGGSVVLPGVSLPWRVEGAADYSGDGSTDIIWRNGTTGETHLWLMSRTVYSGSVVLPPVGAPWDIEGTGDYTQDGRPDIVWRNYGTGETHIWLMNRTVYSGSNVVPFVPTNWRVEGP